MEKKEKLYLHINVRMDREVDKQEYLWNYVSSYLGSMGLEYLGTSEYQPLERMPEETKESNSTPLEPLQNGEREELKKIRDIIERDSECEYGVNDEDVAEVMEIIKDLLSQSKKEGENDYEIGFDDGWHTCCRENNIENDARILYLRREENINRFKESLTNQKKVI